MIVLLASMFLTSCYNDNFKILTHNGIGYWQRNGKGIVMAFSKHDSIMKYIHEDMTPAFEPYYIIKYGRRFRFAGDTLLYYVRGPYDMNVESFFHVCSMSINKIILKDSVKWIRFSPLKHSNDSNRIKQNRSRIRVADTDSHLTPGMFSVSQDKMVRFTKGNLYWDGSNYHLEKRQYDCPNNNAPGAKWNPNHVSHFFYSDNEKEARAIYRTDTVRSNSNLWCNVNKKITIDGVEGLYVLKEDEWYYLLFKRENARNLCKCGVVVCGKPNCLIIAPDGYSGGLSSFYNEKSWIRAEKMGFVCLPTTGFRKGDKLTNGGVNGCYWCVDDMLRNKGYNFMNIDYGFYCTSYCKDEEGRGYAIRLVK